MNFESTKWSFFFPPYFFFLNLKISRTLWVPDLQHKNQSQKKHVFLTVCNNSVLFECIWFCLERKSACLSFIPECVGGSASSVSFWITTVSVSKRRCTREMVFLTTVLYIFLLVLVLDCWGRDCSVLQERAVVVTYASRCLCMCWESFQQKRQFYEGISSK